MFDALLFVIALLAGNGLFWRNGNARFFFASNRTGYSGGQKCNRQRTHTWNAEQRLICDLLDNYQVKWGRPVRNMTEDVEVRFGLKLIHISDLVCRALSQQTHPLYSVGWEKSSPNHQSMANLRMFDQCIISLITSIICLFSGMGRWRIDMVGREGLFSYSLSRFLGIRKIMVNRKTSGSDFFHRIFFFSDNLMDIRLPIKRIWQPDVTLYN